MEQLGDLIQTNELPNKLSESPKHSLTKSSISAEEYYALWQLINKSRLLNGWMTRPMAELDDTIEVWGEMFRHYKIPASAYPQLYHRAFEARQRAMNRGDQIPTMDATLLVSQWTGDNGLEKELRDKNKISADKQLYGESYTLKCSWCLDQGRILSGPRKGQPCPHRD